MCRPFLCAHPPPRLLPATPVTTCGFSIVAFVLRSEDHRDCFKSWDTVQTDRREQSPRECCLELVRPRLTVSGPRLTVSGPTPPDLASVVVSCGAYHQPPVPAPNIRGRDLPLPLYHSTMHSPSPYTRHTRDLAFAGQMLMHSNAFKMKSKHTKLIHAKPVRRIAIAHTPCGRAPRAPITTRLTYLSPMRRRWVAPFCSSGLPPSA